MWPVRRTCAAVSWAGSAGRVSFVAISFGSSFPWQTLASRGCDVRSEGSFLRSVWNLICGVNSSLDRRRCARPPRPKPSGRKRFATDGAEPRAGARAPPGPLGRRRGVAALQRCGATAPSQTSRNGVEPEPLIKAMPRTWRKYLKERSGARLP